MVLIGRLNIGPELMNSSCAWASDLKQLRELYRCPSTGAVTTRTAILNGFNEKHPDVHTVAFASESISSVNSYGYSPFALSQYLDWIEQILSEEGASPSNKPFIVSITSSETDELAVMISRIQVFRGKIGDGKAEGPYRIGVELNTSCPNIENKPPSSYTPHTLNPLLAVLASAHANDPTLTIGLKLPPYTYATQFEDIIRLIGLFTLRDASGRSTNPFAFLTCTNTLGSSLLFADQTSLGGAGDNRQGFALPTPLGGLAGEAIHSIALGNVFNFSKLLRRSEDEALREVKIIGVGGVTSPEAVDRMRRAGASVVACATFLGREGVGAFELLSKN